MAAVFLASGSAGRTYAAVSLLANGTFETGSFAGWTVQNQAGGTGNWYIDTPGSTTPESSFPTLGNAGGGSFYAVTDQNGPGTHALLQSFTVPVDATSVTLSFEMFVNDQDGGPFVSPAGLDHNSVPNQHARVDILTDTAGAFSTAGADVLGNFYLGVDAGTVPNPYTPYVFDVTGILTPGSTYQLRFGEVDNQLFFQMGVDNVSVIAQTSDTAGVPEASSIVIWGLGAAAVALATRIRRRLRVRPA